VPYEDSCPTCKCHTIQYINHVLLLCGSELTVWGKCSCSLECARLERLGLRWSLWCQERYNGVGESRRCSGVRLRIC
jgi:hypothetical protein